MPRTSITINEAYDKQSLDRLINEKLGSDIGKLIGMRRGARAVNGYYRRDVKFTASGSAKVEFRKYSKIGLQGLWNKYRATLVKDIGQDVDIVNSQPVLFYELIQRVNKNIEEDSDKLQSTYLKQYIDNRNDIFEELYNLYDF